MKIKIVGFKVGKSRPTANRTATVREFGEEDAVLHADLESLGSVVYATARKSDFISIRRVDD